MSIHVIRVEINDDIMFGTRIGNLVSAEVRSLMLRLCFYHRSYSLNVVYGLL